MLQEMIKIPDILHSLLFTFCFFFFFFFFSQGLLYEVLFLPF